MIKSVFAMLKTRRRTLGPSHESPRPTVTHWPGRYGCDLKVAAGRASGWQPLPWPGQAPRRVTTRDQSEHGPSLIGHTRS